MTKEELDFIGTMNMCDEISNEAYKKIVNHVEETEISDNCVSRKAILDAITKIDGNINMDIYTNEVREIIRELPLVTPTQNKWHLVKDELPKEFSFVNCTCHSLVDDRGNWVIETCYIPQYPNSRCSDWGNIPMLNDGECEVIAWMYRDIPEPYKAEMESEDGSN